MKREELKKYVGELSPELQEKARECKTMEELQSMLAENDVELSEDALQAVAGGCSDTTSSYNQGDPMPDHCPECGCTLYYWDMCAFEKKCSHIIRMYCNNPNCSSYHNGLWFKPDGGSTIQKY